MAFVKPKEGLRVPIPGSSRALAAKGGDVDIKNTYWRRRLRDGSIVVIKDNKKTSKPPPPSDTDGKPSDDDGKGDKK